ncbi:ABC transporter ATP-binding protein [Ornithinimicrobium humiphilum]|uniref:Amino acid/amide ABC transporter ATP-binding protein 2 (HAAT family) n=1 Tax=Ornithinimicrobium humiphilum TaxID=125288 RepID=A0A543K8C4_9MICO|nr:ABC transporter ATP-binding protein [Ornithinimicrobium humiphilum]TQM91283.1 amino acid/amide ABC transporter ATP-binding protein 2 (HAAT family) [Ornithinimicrobium humiphilum]
MSTEPVPAGTVLAGGAPAGAGPALLNLNNVEVIYDDVILVLRGLSLQVPEGKIVALLGSNGAGKSTTLKAVSGLLPSEHGEVTDGTIIFAGEDITKVDAADRVTRGMSLCMEGRHVFEHLTISENLVAGAYTQKNVGADLDEVYSFFPKLGDMRNRIAGYLSGGEQQMLAIGRALMARPKLLMLDEPSLGLAPLLVQEIFGYIKRLNEERGLTVLVIEQNARRALEVADHGYIMEQGRIVLEGPAAELRENPDVKEFYLGLGEEGGRKSYRDVKHYKRRKRWL